MPDLIADQFFNDPRVADAKRLVLDALREHQSQLTGPRPPRDDLAQSYDDALAAFSDVRGGALYYRYLGSGLGNGALVELADGSVKYDMITGIGVHGFGHSHASIVSAGLDAAIRDTVMQGNLQQGAESFALGRLLLDKANESGASLAHCFLSTSGATANENALKIAFQKHHPADRVLAFTDCFAGRTVALAQMTDRPKYRDGLPTAMAVDYVPFFNHEDPEASTRHAVRVLERHLSRYPNQHAAMCFELIQGEGGYWPGDRNFFAALIDVLKRADVAVWMDEVQTFGRTTRPFAFQHFDLDEHVDLVTIGKITQVCATLYRDDYKPRPGLVSQTFTGATSSIFAAQAIVEGLINGNHFGEAGRNAQVHERFANHLQRIADAHPGSVAGPFGQGGMIAFTPADGSPDAAKRVAHALFDAGVIGFITGSNPARVRFLPPLGVVTDDDIDAVCAIVEQVVTTT